MRRAVGVLLVHGATSMLVAIPLWHVTRQDASVCQAGTVCDPRLLLPYGNLAAESDALGIVAILTALVMATLMLVRRLGNRAGSRPAPVRARGRGPPTEPYDDLGRRIVAALGEPAARDVLDVLTRSDADPAALIGRLAQRDDAAWLAELLIEIDSDPEDITRLEIAEALRRTLPS